MMQKVHFRLTSVAQKRCCLSNDNDDGSENVAKKMNLPSFNLNRVYLDPLYMSNAGDFSWSWIVKDFIQV